MKKLNNKGFSLVELIIVIAIMAILVGVMAPQLMKYIEKSRYSSDIQFVDSVESALKVTMANEKAYKQGVTLLQTGSSNLTAILTLADAGTSPYDDFCSEVQEILGGLTASEFEFTSLAFTGSEVVITMDGNGVIQVTATSNNPDEYPSYPPN